MEWVIVGFEKKVWDGFISFVKIFGCLFCDGEFMMVDLKFVWDWFLCLVEFGDVGVMYDFVLMMLVGFDNEVMVEEVLKWFWLVVKVEYGGVLIGLVWLYLKEKYGFDVNVVVDFLECGVVVGYFGVMEEFGCLYVKGKFVD